MTHPKQTTFNFRLTDNQLLILLGLAGALLHFLLNGGYGFHRDELDIIMNARQLDWGFVAYPPLTPLLARLSLWIFGPSLPGMRLFPALAQGVVLVLTGLMAREMGGKRGAQVLAAVAGFIGPVALMTGTLIQYMSFDYLWWVLMAYFMVRLIARDDPRSWLGIGAAIGLGLQTKYTIGFWVVGLIAAVFFSPLRKYLRSKWLWLGAGLAFLIFLPNLVWQVQHQFISLKFLSSIHARDIQWGRADSFIVDQLYATTNPFCLGLWLAGLLACLISEPYKRFRPLVWMFLVTLILFMVTRGRGYYTAPSYVMLLAAGSAWFESWLEKRSLAQRRVGLGVAWTLMTLGLAVGVVLIKPVAPINSALWRVTSDINDNVVEMIGWQDLTAQVAEIYAKVPPEKKARTVILAGNYGEAGALELYGSAYALPRIISGGNSMWARGYGDFEPETVIVVGFEGDYARKFFAECTYQDTVKNQYNVQNEESSWHTGLYLCSQPRRPWSEMWPEMQWFQ
jgi:4-amino-4-deoxy-L-arabinose transferase-like glycosyltransferase